MALSWRPDLPTARGWTLVLGVSVTQLVSWGVLVYAFSVLVVPMRAELGWSPALLNAGYAVAMVTSGVLAVPVGRWLQARGARGLMVAGSVLAAAVLASWSGVHSVPVFFGVFVLAGVAMAMSLYEVAFAVTTAWFRQLRSRAVLVVTVFGGFASVVFIPVTGALSSTLGWRQALLVLAVWVAAFNVPVLALSLRRPAQPATAAPLGQQASRADIVRSASFRWLTVCLTCSTAGRVAVAVVFVAYLVDRGFSLKWAALVAGTIGLTQVGGRVLVTLLRRWVAEAHTTCAVFVAQGLVMALPLATTGHDRAAAVAIWVFVLVFGLGVGLSELLRGTLVADYYGAEQFPSVNGVLSTFVVGARAAGPFVAGLAYAAFDSYAPVLVGAGVTALVGAGSLLAAGRARRAELAT
ncbi:MAG: MFS transporter [Streptosporangiales bacterium]|nr:MFS transporter [Streptosporangiales bacterium]